MDAARWFTPRELAAWQRQELGGNLRVELPALQRGSAWRPHQTELLWDSLLRGFPIGILLLAEYDRSRGRRRADAQGESAREPDFHLLDGQQRWNSITLGFLDNWRDSSLQAALWIDLDTLDELAEGRRFIFRVVTRSHPWGYRRYDPSQRLTASLRQGAFAAFEAAAKAANVWQSDYRLGSLPLSLSWPWEAAVPVPVGLLTEAIRAGRDEDGAWRNLESALSRLPYWAKHEGEPPAITDWRDHVTERLRDRTPHMGDIFRGMRDNLGLSEYAPYRIPALIAPVKSSGSLGGTGRSIREDPLATLFVRVNVAGTRPSDDELRFSMLKSVCSDVQDIAEQLGRRLMSPAKLVTLLSRLVLARRLLELPGEPDLARFRRLVHGDDDKCPDFLQLMRQYLGLDSEGTAIRTSDGKPAGRARHLIEAAVDLLGYGSWGLPAVSIANIAAASRSMPFFFLLMAWLDRRMSLNTTGQNAATLDEEARQLIVGAVSTMAWFAERSGDCLLKLWERLHQYSSDQKIDQFFSPGMMAECLLSEGRRALVPPVPPSCLREAIQQGVDGLAEFGTGNGGVWTQQWNRWQSLDLESAANTLFETCKIPHEQRMAGFTQGVAGHLWGMRELLHYAQRQQLKSWFPLYDPSSPDQLEDTDRPWDYDHIFPASYGQQVNGLPSLIKEWFNSVGNLRVWPLEANRASGDAHPAAKLDSPLPQEKASPFNLRDGVQMRLASCIAEEDWRLWRVTTPAAAKPDWHRYLADPQTKDQSLCRPVLVRAISSRWVKLYSEWFSELRIEKLFKVAS